MNSLVSATTEHLRGTYDVATAFARRNVTRHTNAVMALGGTPAMASASSRMGAIISGKSKDVNGSSTSAGTSATAFAPSTSNSVTMSMKIDSSESRRKDEAERLAAMEREMVNVPVFPLRYFRNEDDTLVPKVVYRVARDCALGDEIVWRFCDPWGWNGSEVKWTRANQNGNCDYALEEFTEETSAEFIKSMFDSRVVNAYMALPTRTMREHMFGACILFVRGGVFVDSMLRPFSREIDLSEWTQKECFVEILESSLSSGTDFDLTSLPMVDTQNLQLQDFVSEVEILRSDHRAQARSTSRASALNIDEWSMERERSKMKQNVREEDHACCCWPGFVASAKATRTLATAIERWVEFAVKGGEECEYTMRAPNSVVRLCVQPSSGDKHHISTISVRDGSGSAPLMVLESRIHPRGPPPSAMLSAHARDTQNLQTLPSDHCGDWFAAQTEGVTQNGAEQDVIPLHVYQTWSTTELLPGMKQCRELLQSQNPEFTFHLFDDDACRGFIRDNFDSRVLNAYDTLIPTAYKADLWRYCVLYNRGGVYLDCKYYCLNEFKLINLIRGEHLTWDVNKNVGDVFNAVMVCAPRTELMRAAIERVVANVEERLYLNGVLAITGPAMLGDVYKARMANDDEACKRIEFMQHVYDATVHGLIFHPKWQKYVLGVYPTYRLEQRVTLSKSSSNLSHYGDLWRKRKVYN